MYRTLIAAVFFLCSLTVVHSQTTDELMEVTKDFIGTLEPESLAWLDLEFDDPLRTRFSFLPEGTEPRNGLRFGNLSEESKIAFHRVLATLFSSQGYLKITSIMELDDKLNALYESIHEREFINQEMLDHTRSLKWDQGNYFIWIYGKPDKYEPWALKFEGHHVSVNVTVIGEEFSITPLFLGAEPAEVNYTRFAGLRVLAKEEDYGFRLLHSLDDAQKATAVLKDVIPEEIVTLPGVALPEPQGIKGSAMTDGQKGLLHLLLHEYIHNLEFGRAHEYYEHLVGKDMDDIHFAWIGGEEKHTAYHYIIQGPDFLIEFNNVGLNKDGNHIHSIWREKGNDFGAALLKEHYEKYPKK